MTVRPEVGHVESLVGRLAAIDRQEADLYGLNAPKKSEIAPMVVGQAISDEELDIQLARLTSEERETFMMLCQKMEGRWVEPPAIEDASSVETTATTVQPNGE
jgi:hypothetical protein